MKFILLALILSSCAVGVPSKYRCVHKIGIEKDMCLNKYKIYMKHLDYTYFREGGFNNHHLER